MALLHLFYMIRHGTCTCRYQVNPHRGFTLQLAVQKSVHESHNSSVAFRGTSCNVTKNCYVCDETLERKYEI